MKSLRREGWWSWIVLWGAVGVLDVMVLAVGFLLICCLLLWFLLSVVG